MKRLILVACFAIGVLTGPAQAASSYIKGFLQVRHPWTRVIPAGANVSAVYLEIRNSGKESDRLIAASTPAAERVEMHVMAREGGAMRMRQVESLNVPARKQLVLRPNGAHLMIVGPTRTFVKGHRIPLVLRFERGGDVHVEVEVRAAGATKLHH